MMRTTISRKLIECTIRGHLIEFVNGEPVLKELEPVVAYGNLTRGEALKELRRVYGRKEGLTVGEIQAVEKNYQISVSDFVKHAKVINPETIEN